MGIHGIVTIPFFEPETLGVIDLTVFGRNPIGVCPIS
jgi:hypothetical protein